MDRLHNTAGNPYLLWTSHTITAHQIGDPYRYLGKGTASEKSLPEPLLNRTASGKVLLSLLKRNPSLLERAQKKKALSLHREDMAQPLRKSYHSTLEPLISTLLSQTQHVGSAKIISFYAPTAVLKLLFNFSP